jgi:hypothetical protein
MKAVVAWVSALLAVIGLGVAAEAAVGVHSAPRSALAMEIDQYAVDFAAAEGDPTPVQVTWVATRNAEANDVLGHSGGDATLVYALEITGQFLPNSFSVAAGSKLSGGTDLQLVVQRSGFVASTIGLSDTLPSLSSLGSPETDSLAGLSPITGAAFSAEFHLPPSPLRGR